jgi:hypothetical protein
MEVKVWKLIGLMFITFFALSAATASAAPTMSSLAGTYSSETGYTIVLYENGTGLFSSHSGTWSIFNSTTIEGTYRILSVHTDYFTITSNGFIAAGTGNVYVRNASASSTPAATATAIPTSATSTPNVPEFSNVILISVAAAMAVVALGAVVLTKRPRKQLRK